MIWQSTLTPSEQDELSISDPVTDRPDVVIVGGGMAGLATAYFLSLEGLAVQVLEASSICGGATGGSLGGIWPSHRPEASPSFRELARASRDLWARLAVRPEFQFDWRVTGLLDATATSLPEASVHVADAQSDGISVTAVDAGQILHLEPQLGSAAAAGLHFPSEAHLNPLKAALSFARAARRRGARVSQNVQVVSADLTDQSITALHTRKGTVLPGSVVIATGWQMDWTRPWLTVPLRPISGQVIASDSCPPIIRSCIQWRQMIVQLRTGQILLGADVREGPETDVDPGMTDEFLRNARQLIPALQEIEFPHVWRSVRAATPDGWPVVDRIAETSNIWLSLGHYRHGLLLAPLLGRLLAESLRDGKVHSDLALFTATRFSSRP